MNLEIVKCVNCNIDFGMPEDLVAQRRKDGQEFSYPNGHKLHFGDSDMDKLKRKLKAADDLNDYYRLRVKDLEVDLAFTRRQSAGYKSQWMRLKRKMEIQITSVIPEMSVEQLENLAKADQT